MTAAAEITATLPGCEQSLSTPAAVIQDEVTEMKIAEQGSGSVVTPAKLTGKLKLPNSSTDQTIRLIGGKIQFIDEGDPPRPRVSSVVVPARDTVRLPVSIGE